jgi:tetratricopeptide (TPR) repeat protein
VADRSKRWVVTCLHVIGEHDTADVIFPVRQGGKIVGPRSYYLENFPKLQKQGFAVRAKVVRRDPVNDLALLELESLPPEVGELAFAESGAMAGDEVHVVGNRHDLGTLWAHGTGSVREVRVLKDGYFTGGRQLAKGATVLVAQVPINEGDSGGPLVNARGQVVGVSAAVAWNEQGAGLFVDVRAVRRLLQREASGDGLEESGGRYAYRRGIRQVVLIEYEGGSRACGVVLDRKRRLILTTADAVAKEETVEVTFPVFQNDRLVADPAFYRSQRSLLANRGAVARGVVLALDARRNLALVEAGKLPDTASEAAIAARLPQPGESLHAISSPARSPSLWLYAAASVRQTDRLRLGAGNGPDPEVILVQAPLAEGEGGGPIFNRRGELAALASGKVGPQQQVVYAIAACEIEAFLHEVQPRSQPRTAMEWGQRAEVFVKARNLARALEDLNAALRLDAHFNSACIARARIHRLRGDLEHAWQDAENAVRLDPKQAAAWAERSAVRSARGEFLLALADADRALKIDGKLAPAWVARGLAQLMLSLPDQAIAACDEAIWLDRKMADAFLVRGRGYLIKKDYAKAVVDFTGAADLDPKASEPWRRRADAQWEGSDVTSALADYEHALKLNSRDAGALQGRGRIRLAQGQSAKALADFAAALRIEPNRATVYLDRAGERLARNRISEAIADLTRAWQLRPALANRAVSVIEKRGNEMMEGRHPNSEAAADLYRQALVAFIPLLKDKSAAEEAKAMLADSQKQTDVRKRAAFLSGALKKLQVR